MAAVDTQKPKRWRSRWGSFSEFTHEVHRGFIAEWTVTIILLLFATTTLVQAFVIPSASMVATLLIGDHVLVDKLVYAPSGAISHACFRIAKCGGVTSSCSATPSTSRRIT